METYQKQYIEVQSLLDFIEKTKEILHDSSDACRTLDIVKTKIAFTPKKIGTVLRIQQAIDRNDLLYTRQEGMDRYIDYMKEAQAKELGIYCHKNGMIKTSVIQDADPFHEELVQSEIEILTADTSELNQLVLS